MYYCECLPVITGQRHGGGNSLNKCVLLGKLESSSNIKLSAPKKHSKSVVHNSATRTNPSNNSEEATPVLPGEIFDKCFDRWEFSVLGFLPA